MSGSAGPSKRGMRLALAAAALLVLVAGAAFYYASLATRGRTTAADEITVTIAGKACDPNELTVPAGRRIFRIVNQSDRAVEWEILDGVMVVAERENIAPGISQTLTAKLVPGTYEITCGLLSNPRGTLTVTDSAEAAAEAARPPMTSFIGPMAQYQLDLVLGAQAFVEATRSFTDAVKAGDLEQARQLYLPARIAYAKIEPTAARFGDLATAIDGQAEYFEKREQDPGFKGLHRLEHTLFAAGDPAAATAAADALLADATELQARIAKLQPAPEQPLAATSALLTSVAQARVSHGADHYALSDLPVFAAEIDGGGRVIELFRPLLSKANPALMTEVSERLAAVQATLEGYQQQDGYVAYDRLDEAARATLAKQIQDLADSVAKMNAALGLE